MDKLVPEYRIHIRVTEPELIEGLDKAQEAGGYASRNALILEAIKEKIEKIMEGKNERGEN